MKILNHPLTIALAAAVPISLLPHQVPTTATTLFSTHVQTPPIQEIRTPCIPEISTDQFLSSVRTTNSNCTQCKVTCPDSDFEVTFQGKNNCSQSCGLGIDPCSGGLLPTDGTFSWVLDPRPLEFSLPLLEGLTSLTVSSNTLF